MYDKTKYIYVGLDLHKEQHTAVIMDCFNEKLGEITFQNKPSEFGKLITKCKKYCTDGKGIVFALENSYGYGRALAAWLIERNYIVKDVNPALSYAYRKSVPQYKKNDSYDAQCLARVAINELNKLIKKGQQKVDKQGCKQWKCSTVATTDWNSPDNAKEWRAEWAERKPTLLLPLVKGKYISSISNRDALLNFDNARSYVKEYRIDSFSSLATLKGAKIKEHNELGQRTQIRSQKIARLKALAKAYSECEAYKAVQKKEADRIAERREDNTKGVAFGM